MTSNELSAFKMCNKQRSGFLSLAITTQYTSNFVCTRLPQGKSAYLSNPGVFLLTIAILVLSVLSTFSQNTTSLNDSGPVANSGEILEKFFSFPTNSDLHIMPLQQSLPILPELDFKDGSLPSQFQIFDQQVKPGAVFPQSSSETGTIFDKLRSIINKIELGSPSLTSQDQEDLVNAQKLLYSDAFHIQKSSAYLKYLQYQQKESDLLNRLKNSQNSAERSSLQNSLATNERDWRTFGSKDEISAAKTVEDSHDSRKIKDDFNSWSKVVEDSKNGDFTGISLAFDNLSDWREFTLPVSNQSGLKIRIYQAGVTSPLEVNAPKISEILMKVIMVKIKRPAFDHPFLEAKTWRIAGPEVVSGGVAGADSQNEICPRIANGLVIAKQVELFFETVADAKNFASIVDSSQTVFYGDLPIKSKDTSCTFTISRMLSLNSPYVIAVVAWDLPKIPDPDPKLRWQ